MLLTYQCGVGWDLLQAGYPPTHKTHQAFIGLVVNLQPKSAGYGLTTFVSSAM